jgi:hypothetical protein
VGAAHLVAIVYETRELQDVLLSQMRLWEFKVIQSESNCGPASPGMSHRSFSLVQEEVERLDELVVVLVLGEQKLDCNQIVESSDVQQKCAVH